MKLNILKGFFALTLLVSTTVGCKKIDPTKDVEVTIDATLSKTAIGVQFVDAKTGVQLNLDGTSQIDVFITGYNKAAVVDNFGGTKIASDFGLMAVSIASDVIPSASNPVQFTVNATSSGYLPASKAVTLSQEGFSSLTIPMIKISDAPDGISIAQGVISAVPTSGITPVALSVSPSGATASNLTATVNVPSGTKLMDKNGAAVSGNVTATMAYTNPLEGNLMNLFPGSISNAKLNDGSYVAFNTLGIISLDMNSASKEAKTFSSPIEMTMEIPSGFMNGTEEIVVGSTIEIYSYDDTKDEWKKESTPVVSSNGNGGLQVVFQMTHLSLWQGTIPPLVTGRFPTVVNVNFTGSCLKDLNSVFKIDRYKKYYFQSSYFYYYYESNGANIDFSKTVQFESFAPDYLAEGSKEKYIITNKNNTSEKIEFIIENTSDITVQVPASWCPPAPPKDFTIKLTVTCPENPTRKIKPPCVVYAQEEGFTGPFIPLGNMQAGELITSTSKFNPTKKYIFWAFYINKLVLISDLGASFQIDGNDIQLGRPLSSFECTFLRSK